MVQQLVEHSRGTSPPQITELDLETQKSASVMHADEALKTSPREIALWSLAAVVAIVLGVLPALWINRWRAESAAAPPVETQQPQAAATDDDAEPALIEMTADPEPETAAVPGATAIKTPKPHRQKTERVKQPPPPPPRARKQPPPCDVYLHPKGCPR